MRGVAKRFDVKVVGVSFHPGYPRSLWRHANNSTILWDIVMETRDEDGLVRVSGAELEASLIREPENPHDPNAIAVLMGGEPVGHLPRGLAARLAPEIDAGGQFRVAQAEVLIVPEYAEHPAVTLTVERA